MRIAVVGAGSIGRRHIRNLLALGCEVVAYDVDASVICRNDWPGACEFVKHLPDALTVDAVVIAAPVATHATLARTIQDHAYRKALFVEKPLARSVQEAALLAAWPHPTTMVGYNWRFHPDVRAVWARRHKWPEPRAYWAFTTDTDMRLWPGREYGDPLLECSHDVDLALWWGAQSQVTAAGHNESWLPDGFHLTLGGNYHVRLNWSEANPRRIIETQDQWPVGVKFLTGENPTNHWKMQFYDSIKIDLSYQYEMRHFLECVGRQSATETPFSDGLRVLEVCEQAQRMAMQAV